MKQKRDIQIKSSKSSFEFFSPEHKNADILYIAPKTENYKITNTAFLTYDIMSKYIIYY